MNTEKPVTEELLDEHIAGLRELTKMLRGGSEVEHGCAATGVWRGVGLLHREGVAVLDSVAEAGVDLPAHVHECAEVLVVYRGSIRVEVAGEVRVYGVSESVEFPAGVVHKVTPLDSPTAVIGVTVPAEESYPQAPHGGSSECESEVR